jgi:hypothetical protein
MSNWIAKLNTINTHTHNLDHVTFDYFFTELSIYFPENVANIHVIILTYSTIVFD